MYIVMHNFVKLKMSHVDSRYRWQQVYLPVYQGAINHYERTPVYNRVVSPNYLDRMRTAYVNRNFPVFYGLIRQYWDRVNRNRYSMNLMDRALARIEDRGRGRGRN